MKKAHILISALAVVLAIGSAFSTVENRRLTTYYESSTPGANCDANQIFTGAVCPEGDLVQCEVAPGQYISKKVASGSNCEMHKRD